VRFSILMALVAVTGCAHAMPSTLPAATSPSSDAALRYRLRTEYITLDPQGTELGTRVVTGEFTVTSREVQWTRVTVGQAPAHGQPPASEEHRPFAEGIRYPLTGVTNVLTADFFRDYPATANDEKNLIWDELMFDSFARHHLDGLRLNETSVIPSGDVALAGSGTFTNRRIELTWIGLGQRHAERCLLVHYEALLNHFGVRATPVVVSGRSDYAGLLWISQRTRRIEYGTLVEEVAGTVANIPGSAGPQPLHVLRLVTLERLEP